MDDHPILVVEDDARIREQLLDYLGREGFAGVAAADAGSARTHLQEARFSLVLLDILMPGEDGLSLCRHIREAYGIPLILVTARGEEIDRIIGLELGADDYVAKPFSPRELLARIRAVLRRAMAPPLTGDVAAARTFRFNGLTLKTDERVLVGPDGVGMSLSTGEYNLIQAFVTRPRVILTREQLLDLTRGRTADVFDRSIDNMVSRLRRKVEPDPKSPTVIKTIWGSGYMLSAEVTAE